MIYKKFNGPMIFCKFSVVDEGLHGQHAKEKTGGKKSDLECAKVGIKWKVHEQLMKVGKKVK